MIEIEFKYLGTQDFYKLLNIISHFFISSSLFKFTEIIVRKSSSKELYIEGITKKDLNIIYKILYSQETKCFIS
jgi:hypothetical protein